MDCRTNQSLYCSRLAGTKTIHVEVIIFPDFGKKGVFVPDFNTMFQ